MEKQSLSEIIQSTLAEVEPKEAPEAPVNQEVEEVDGSEDTEVTVDDLIADLVENDEDDEEVAETEESEEEVEEDKEADPSLDETYQVKVDGEVIDVTLKEALEGYQRQADYTRKAQALAAEKQQLESTIQEFSEVLGSMEQLDSAWDDNPVQVLAHFTANTENPTHAVALLIKELASANLLEQDFLDMFGITKEVKETWGQEAEVDNLRRKVSRTEQEQLKQQQALAYENEVQRAMSAYVKQVDEIVEAEGLKLTSAQREAFQQRLASYAFENEITNLKAAYKALKFEQSEKKKAAAVKTKERAKQKKAASVVGRSGASASGASPVSDNSNLTDVIRQAMSELDVR